ncbi:MAG TPA: alpha/beta fold hydrolase [Niabella sp.]|nr:alpha/beta fold hydrolase [Niabella sp.]
MTSDSFSQSSNKTYILVHGAGHGAWCWKKVIPLLKTKGFKAIAPDLPSCGDDTAKLASITLDDDVKKVVDAANVIDEKVILVGHSSGGVVISQAAELLGPTKIDKLIYLDAFLPQNGESVFSLAEKIRKSNEASSVLKPDVPASERFLFTEDGKSFKWNPELVRQLFYHDCSQEDIIFAKKNLTWNSVANIATPVHLSDSSYGIIKKYYILCTKAKDLDKSSIVSNVYCEKVYKLSSSHSPFFSMPDKLLDILIDIY